MTRKLFCHTEQSKEMQQCISNKKQHCLINCIGHYPPIMDHLNVYVGNSQDIKGKSKFKHKLCAKLISFSIYPKRLCRKSKIANDRNKESPTSGLFTKPLKVTWIGIQTQIIAKLLFLK